MSNFGQSIEFRIRRRDIRNALEVEKNLTDKLNKACQGMLLTLAHGVENEIRQAYNNVPYDGFKDYNVEIMFPEGTDKSYMQWFKVVISGQAANFLEYGAGITYGSPYAGEYGKGHGSQKAWAFTNMGQPVMNGKLIHKGKYILTNGNPPADGIGKAHAYINEHAEEALNRNL